MKKASLLFVLLCVSTLIFAQTTTQTATLKHGDNITAYYGPDALIAAHTAAQTGDVITLSSGSFNSLEITKAITIRGAGCTYDPETGTSPTVITGWAHFSFAGDETRHLTIEGIQFPEQTEQTDFLYGKFIRCHIGTMRVGRIENALFIDCFIKQFYANAAKNITFINSVVWQVWNCDDNRPLTFQNCVFGKTYPKRVSATNCIVNTNEYLGATNTFVNCIFIRTSGYNDANIINCTKYESFVDICETFHGNDPDFDEMFILKNYIANNFLGDDGTEISIHGGTMPYGTRPTYMTPYRNTVDHESTPAGKLNVHIEVIDEGK